MNSLLQLVIFAICKSVSLCYSLRTEASSAALCGSASSNSHSERLSRHTHTHTHTHAAQTLWHFLSRAIFLCLRAGSAETKCLRSRWQLTGNRGQRSGLSGDQMSIFSSVSGGEGIKTWRLRARLLSFIHGKSTYTVCVGRTQLLAGTSGLVLSI